MIRSSLLFFVLLLFACVRDNCNGLGRKGVCIQVVNKSGQRVVKMILIAPERHRQKKINEAIEIDGQTYITYKAGGESSYQLLFIMENGDTIQSQQGYAEGGYRFKDVIKKDHVASHHDSY